jgi:tRNA(Ile)-lysidine synthase
VLQQDCAGSIVEQLADLSQSARRLNNMICRRADKIWLELARHTSSGLADSTADRVALKLESFLPEHPAVKVELIRRSLGALGSGERDLVRPHYERILRLADQNGSDKKIELPSRFLVRREYGDLILSRPGKPRVKRGAKYYLATLEIPGRTRFGRYSIEASVFEVEKENFEAFKAKKGDFVECFDLYKLKLPLVVRLRQDGDRFWPLGLSAEKKVGKFLTDAKVPQEIRRKVVIVADREKIIWVCPIRISESAKVTDKTGKILQLQIVV